MNSVKYPIVMTNGQRIYHNPSPSPSPPPRGSEIFIGNLPRDLFEDELIPILSQVAPIYKFRLMMDFTGNNRGFGFASYYTPEDAHKAVIRFNRTYIRSKTRKSYISVHVSLDNCRLFFGNVPKDTPRGEIEAELMRIADGVARVIVYSERANPSRNRGFAFVEFESHGMAAIARRKMLAGVGNAWRDRDGKHHKLYVDWAEPEPIVDPMVLTEVTILYFKNVPLHWSSDRFKDFIEKILKNLDIEKMYKRDNYAFVHFFDRRGAEIALKLLGAMSHYLIFSGQQMEVEWARPADYSKRNRANHLPENLCLSVPPRTRKLIHKSKKTNNFTLNVNENLSSLQNHVSPSINTAAIEKNLSSRFEMLSLGTGF